MHTLIILILFLVLFSFLCNQYSDYNKTLERPVFINYPLEGYWKHGFHNMLIGIDGNKIILTSRVGKQYVRKYGIITDVYDNCLCYTSEGIKHKIEYYNSYILWNGIKYTNPELDKMKVYL